MAANWGHCNTIMGHVNDAMQIRIAKSQRVFAWGVLGTKVQIVS